MSENKQLRMKAIGQDFSVCKVKDYSQIDLGQPFVFTGSTDEEKSLVCPTAIVPQNTVERDDGWKALRIIGILDFSLIGILARISSVLAENRIGMDSSSIGGSSQRSFPSAFRSTLCGRLPRKTRVSIGSRSGSIGGFVT